MKFLTTGEYISLIRRRTAVNVAFDNYQVLLLPKTEPTENPCANVMIAISTIELLRCCVEKDSCTRSIVVDIPSKHAEDILKLFPAVFQKVAFYGSRENFHRYSVGVPSKDAFLFLEDATKRRLLHPLLEDCWNHRKDALPVTRGLGRLPRISLLYGDGSETSPSDNSQLPYDAENDPLLQLERDLFPGAFAGFPVFMTLDQASENPWLKWYNSLGYRLILTAYKLHEKIYITHIIIDRQ